MKIDLHVHTIKTKWDNSNRNIKPEKFIKIMNESNVGIVAITNHNMFNNEQYKAIINEKNKVNSNILVLPGVEINTYIDKKSNKKHLNIIVNNDDKSIDDLIEFLKNHNISPENPINIEEVIEHFDSKKDNVIFYIDKKSKPSENGFKNEEVDKYFKENKNFKNAYALDVSPKLFNHCIKHEINSFIGSDNKNWDEYLELSNRLVEYKFNVPTFNWLHDILKNDSMFRIFKREYYIHNYEELDVLNDEGKSVCTIKNLPIIKQSVNVIFGAKATGKTSLLKSLFNNLLVDKNKKCYKNSESDIKIEELAKNMKCYSEYENKFSEYKNYLISKLKEIFKYNEDLEDNYLNKWYLYMLKSEKLTNKYAWINTKTEEIYKIDKICKEINNLIHYLKKAKKLSEENNNGLYKTTNYKLKNLIQSWINEYININKNYFCNHILKKTKNELKKLINIETQTYFEVSKFGLMEIFNKRLKLNNEIEDLKRFINNKDNSSKNITIEEINFKPRYEVPIENSDKKRSWGIRASICLSTNKPQKDTINQDKLSVSNILNSIISRGKKDFSNPDKIINKKYIENNSLEEVFNDEKKSPLKTKFTYTLSDDDNLEHRKPSVGELSYINIKKEFDKDYIDYFFLDEPEEHLNSEFISKYLLEDINNLISEHKTIVMATHNNILGINSEPSNYILRESETVDDYHQTWCGNLADGVMINLFDGENKLKNDISIELLKYFEGSEKLYKYRNKVYKLQK